MKVPKHCKPARKQGKTKTASEDGVYGSVTRAATKEEQEEGDTTTDKRDKKGREAATDATLNTRDTTAVWGSGGHNGKTLTVHQHDGSRHGGQSAKASTGRERGEEKTHELRR